MDTRSETIESLELEGKRLKEEVITRVGRQTAKRRSGVARSAIAIASVFGRAAAANRSMGASATKWRRARHADCHPTGNSVGEPVALDEDKPSAKECSQDCGL